MRFLVIILALLIFSCKSEIDPIPADDLNGVWYLTKREENDKIVLNYFPIRLYFSNTYFEKTIYDNNVPFIYPGIFDLNKNKIEIHYYDGVYEILNVKSISETKLIILNKNYVDIYEK